MRSFTLSVFVMALIVAMLCGVVGCSDETINGSTVSYNDLTYDHPERLPGEVFIANIIGEDTSGYSWKAKRLGEVSYYLNCGELVVIEGDRPLFIDSVEWRTFCSSLATWMRNMENNLNQPCGFFRMTDESYGYVVSDKDDNGLWQIALGQPSIWLKLIEVNEDTEVLMPGDTINVTAELIAMQEFTQNGELIK